MPGMFSSRRRGSSAQPPASTSTLSAAAVAASQAYIKTSQSASLSSAAAAAALRSHTTTPEPVGNLQTKRMMRRGSVSSQTSNAPQGKPGLQRSNSSSSMTERTFRTMSPSPSRVNGRPQATAPPVPSLPRTLRNGPAKRASSTEPPQRVLSPTPANGYRSASVDKVGLASARHKSNLANVPEIDTDKRSSVNFSRPRVGSPDPSPVTQSKGGFGSALESNRPAPISTSQDMEYTMVFDPNSRTFVRSTRPKPVKAEPPPSPVVDLIPKLKPGDYDPATRSIVPMPKPVRTTSTDSDLQPPPRNPARLSPDNSPMISARSAGFLHKQPSMVREDPDAEREAEEATVTLPRAAIQTQQGPSKSYASPTGHQRSSSLDVPRGGHNRGGSLSPSRSARFSTAPITESTIHEPHRGISPAKSAMKHSPSSSIRTASPIATFSPVTNATATTSDTSDNTSTSTDGSKKRKSVRVSFDDAAPVPPLPEKKTARMEVISDDETMQPRPALPLFGSVRRNKTNDSEVDTTQPKIEEKAEPVPPQITSKDISEPDHEPVPAINLHPPTPAVDDGRELGTDDEGRQSDSQKLSNLASGIIFYGEESDDSRARKLNDDRPTRVTRKDSDADEYSDAPETQDQAGFASLDAIVESPMASPVRASAKTPESPVARAGAESPSPTRDWTAATSYWSNVKNQQKAQHERDLVSSDDEKKSKRSFFKRNKNKDSPAKTTTPETPTKSVSQEVKTSPAVVPASPTAPSMKPDKTSPSAKTITTSPSAKPITTLPAVDPAVVTAPPTKSVPSAAAPLKSSLKKTPSVAKTDDSIHMPRTMRGVQAPARTRPQSAQITAKDIPARATRPASVSHFDSFDSVSRQRAPAPIASSSHTAAKISQKFQNDSDSESSFRKKRRPASKDGRMSMRRSMRAGSIDSTQRVASPEPQRARAGSLLRSLSPSSVTSSRNQPDKLRQSLRNKPPSTSARTMRASQAPIVASAPPTSMASKFKSRFVDSDDEDAPRSAAYRSRFADSDEDDTIAEELTPVRGIPRRKGQEDGDSTDLEDESDLGSPRKRKTKGPSIVTNPADVERAMEAARKKLGIAEPGAVAPPTRDRDNDKVLMSDIMSDNGSVAGTQRKKRGFMGGLLRRNKHSTQSVMTLNTAPELPPVASPVLDKTQIDAPASPTPGKLVRRSSNQPKLIRGNSNLSTATAPVASRPHDEHWPLPPPVPSDKIELYKNRDRPQTSDEALQSMRGSERPPNRRSLSARVGFTDDAVAQSQIESEMGSNTGDVISRRTGKKKRFGLLRKAFGLYD